MGIYYFAKPLAYMTWPAYCKKIPYRPPRPRFVSLDSRELGTVYSRTENKVVNIPGGYGAKLVIKGELGRGGGGERACLPQLLVMYGAVRVVYCEA